MTSRPSPMYLLAGGRGADRSQLRSLLKRVYDETGKASPSVAYLGAASDDNPEFFGWIARMLVAAGAGKVVLAAVTGGRRRIEAARRTLLNADLIFVSGGDVENGMERLARSGLIPLLKTLFRKGVPFCGLSAGSIMLAEKWVTWRDTEDDSTTRLLPCLGLAPLLCDTHEEESGWEELHALLKLTKVGTLGYGITSSAALRVTPGGEVRAVGGDVHRFVRSRSGVRRLANVAKRP